VRDREDRFPIEVSSPHIERLDFWDPQGEAMSALGHYWEHPQMPLLEEELHWYAVQTRSRHERIVAVQFREQGVSTFLPMVTRRQRWSDRCKLVEFPLFSGYLFVHAADSPQVRRTVLFTRGVAGFVAMGGEPLSIPDEQIDTVRQLLEKSVCCTAYPFLKVGQRVRIRSGSLEGLEGILVAHNGDRKLVVSVDAIKRSFSIHLEGYDVELL
jgi:transcription elongation factor/antiterminator RfaH